MAETGASGARVVDLAAGTGKLTRPLVDRFAEVVALFATGSSVASLPAAERDEPTRKLRALLPGAYRLRTTKLFWTRLR